MSNVTLYSKSTCPFCVKAKMLLQKLGAEYTEINIGNDDAKRDEMLAKSQGRTSVPQIFIGSLHVGGCDDLFALHDEGKLEELLSSTN